LSIRPVDEMSVLHLSKTQSTGLTINEPKTAPPENVELIAPMIGLVGFVLKKFRKFGESMTAIIS
jgi:hypothetical protein